MGAVMLVEYLSIKVKDMFLTTGETKTFCFDKLKSTNYAIVNSGMIEKYIFEIKLFYLKSYL
jgi:hypothetical protein